MTIYTRENNPYIDRDNAEVALRDAHHKVCLIRARVMKCFESGKVVPDSLMRKHMALENTYDQAKDDFMAALDKAIAFCLTSAGHDMAYGALEVSLPDNWYTQSNASLGGHCDN